MITENVLNGETTKKKKVQTHSLQTQCKAKNQKTFLFQNQIYWKESIINDNTEIVKQKKIYRRTPIKK